MPTIYKKAGSEITELVAEVIRLHHPDLAAEGVTVACLTAEDAEGTGQVLKHHGYPAAAVVRAVPYKQRVQGLADAEITFDLAVWHGLDTDGRTALVDHELYHLEVQKDEHEVTKHDDAGRPKLRLRPHDFEAGGFHAIVRRHGRHALEAQETLKAYQQLRQRSFDWSDDMAGAAEGPEGAGAA